jgi:hypothetical protein
LQRGSSADQQLAVYHDSGQDLSKVVDFLIAETEQIP